MCGRSFRTHEWGMLRSALHASLSVEDSKMENMAVPWVGI